MGSEEIRSPLKTPAGEATLYLNTGDKTKSKYSPQKIHSSIEFGSNSSSQVSFGGLIDGASVKPFVIG